MLLNITEVSQIISIAGTYGTYAWQEHLVLIAVIGGGQKRGGVQHITYPVQSREPLHVWDDFCGQARPETKRENE